MKNKITAAGNKQKNGAPAGKVFKWVINIVLTVFIAVSVIYIVVKEVKAGKAAGETAQAPAGQMAAALQTVRTDTEKNEVQPAFKGSKIVLYYLHGTGRCMRCMLMEQYSKEAVDKYFPEQLNSGVLEFKVLNFDEPQNRHYFTDYKLVTKSLVISLLKDGKEQKYENLNGIWDNSGNREAFHQYVKFNVERYLQEIK